MFVSADSSASAKEEQGQMMLDAKAERRLLTKLDLRIVPILTVMYTLAFLDRVNIGNAVVFGLQKDLHMKGTDYNTALSIFFVPYIIFELPSNILMKKFKPSVWLTSIMFIFGIITTFQGFVQSYGALLACRFLLGLVEAGFFPGCFYIMSMWYRREESQKRFTIFFMSTSIAGAFGGLLASAIGKMDGLHGFHGWRWIFILEGILTSVVALACYFVQPDFPEDVHWLSPEERDLVKRRLQADVGESGRHVKITPKLVLQQFKSLRFIMGGFMYLGCLVPAYGYSFFGPTIINSFGYSPIQTQLRSVPVQVVVTAVALCFAYASDWARHRYWFTIAALSLSVTGYAMLLGIHHSVHKEYGALFLAAPGVMSTAPIYVCWYSGNLSGHAQRAIGTAYQVSLGNIGGIIATYIYRTSDKPKFTTGYSTTMAFIGLALISSTIYYLLVQAQNREYDVEIASRTSEDVQEEIKKTGKFRMYY